MKFEDFTTQIQLQVPSDYHIVKNNLWIGFNHNKPLPDQGWKIHLSFDASETTYLISRVVTFLFEKKVTFKLARTLNILVDINQGVYGPDMVGKAMTIYPINDIEFIELLNTLNNTWSTTKAPSVLNEPKLSENASVSFRYGDFKNKFFIDLNGELKRSVIDDRGARIQDGLDLTIKKVRELGIKYIFERPNPPEILQIVQEKYLIIKKQSQGASLSFQGMEIKTLRPVTIKVGVKNQKVHYKNDFNAIKNEFEIVKVLNSQKYEYSSEVLDCFETDEQIALILSFVEGQSLANINSDLNLKVSQLLVAATDDLHKIGIIHGDLKEENIIFNENNSVLKLIDFGTAGTKGQLIWHTYKTPGYFDLNFERKVFDFEIDNFAIVRILFYLQTRCSVVSIKNDNLTLANLRDIDLSGDHQINKYLDIYLGQHKAEKVIGLDLAKIINAASDYFKEGYWQNGHEYIQYNLDNINIGSAGIIIALIYLRSQLVDKADCDQMILKTLNVLEKSNQSINNNGFFTGTAGVALSLFLGGKLFGEQRFIEVAKTLILSVLSQEFSNFDFFSGLSGTLYIAAILNSYIADDLIESGIFDQILKLTSKIEIQNGLMGIMGTRSAEIETGIAHGSAGLAFTLFHLGRIFANQDLIKLSKSIFLSLANMKVDNGFAFGHKKQISTKGAVWCQGTGGILWALLNSFDGDPDLAHLENESVSLFLKNIKLTNTTICHGMAGQLDIFRLLNFRGRFGDNTAIELKVIKCLEAMIINRNDKQYFISDRFDRVTPDLWLGFLGTACTLKPLNNCWYSFFTPGFFDQILSHVSE